MAEWGTGTDVNEPVAILNRRMELGEPAAIQMLLSAPSTTRRQRPTKRKMGHDVRDLIYPRQALRINEPLVSAGGDVPRTCGPGIGELRDRERLWVDSTDAARSTFGEPKGLV